MAADIHYNRCELGSVGFARIVFLARYTCYRKVWLCADVRLGVSVCVFSTVKLSSSFMFLALWLIPLLQRESGAAAGP